MTLSPEAQAMRERILSEAARLFVRLGYDGISMREIAEACGLSKAGLYYHFKDKQDLFLALLYQHLDCLENLLAEARESAGSTRACLVAFTAAMLTRLPPEMRATTRLAGQELIKLSAEARAGFTQRYQEAFIGPIGAILREGVAHAELRPIEGATLTWALLGLLYPFFTNHTAYTVEQAQSLAETLIGIFMNGAASHA